VALVLQRSPQGSCLSITRGHHHWIFNCSTAFSFQLTNVTARLLLYLSLFVLTCRMVVKSGHLKVRLLICFILREFNVEQRNLFCRTMNYPTLIVWKKLINLIPLSYWYEIKAIILFLKYKTGLYELDMQQFINRPFRHSIRSSSGDFLRPNLCKSSFLRNSYV
jgi:hypothetical protein